MEQKSLKTKKVFFYILLFAFAAVSLYQAFFSPVYKIIPPLFDLSGHRIITALTLRGIDPYTQIDIAAPALPEIGAVPKGFATAPWSLVLGNIIYSGFLPQNYSSYFFFAVNAAALIFLFFIILNAIKPVISESPFKSSYLTAIIIISFISFNLFYPVLLGNGGGFCAVCCVAAALLCEKRPYISGVFLAFALLKPQTALLMCLSLLILKKFKPLFVAAGISAASYAAACILLKKGPHILLKEFLSANIGSGFSRSGFFHFLTNVGNFDNLTLTFASMAFFALITTVMILLIKKRKLNENLPLWVILSIPCLFSPVWSYGFGFSCDRFVLLLPLLAVVYFLITNSNNKFILNISFLFLALDHLIMYFVLSYIINSLLRSTPVFGVIDEFTLHDLILFFIAIVILSFIFKSSDSISSDRKSIG